MKNKLIFYSKSLIPIMIFVCFLSAVSAQPPETSETPRIRDFGWSLKPNADKESHRNEGKRAEAPEAADDDVIRIETNLVVNDILVLDKQGNSIKGLKREQFTVVEDGESQQIETFSPGDDGNVPSSIVLIIDYSGSQFPYIKTSVEAAKVLVDKLKPKDKMAIVTDDVELLVDFTRDKELLKAKLESLKTKALSGKTGRSEQFSALYAALNEIFNEQDVRPIIIFQTDGDELLGLKGGRLSVKNSKPEIPLPRSYVEKQFSFTDILTATEKARATIYTIFPGIQYTGFSEAEQLERAKKDNENRINMRIQMGLPLPPALIGEMSDRFAKLTVSIWLRNQLALAGLAKFTGGWADYLEAPDQADEVYTRILSGINSRYVIGYYPTNEEKDGKRRVVKIEVRGHPEYTVWGRKTYFAPESKN